MRATVEEGGAAADATVELQGLTEEEGGGELQWLGTLAFLVKYKKC